MNPETLVKAAFVGLLVLDITYNALAVHKINRLVRLVIAVSLFFGVVAFLHFRGLEATK